MKDGDAGRMTFAGLKSSSTMSPAKHVNHVDDILKHKEAELLEV